MARSIQSQQGFLIGGDSVIHGPVSVNNVIYSFQSTNSGLLQTGPFCYNYPDFPQKRFVGYSDHLLRLKEWFHNTPGEGENFLSFHAMVVCGMGGTGKTTLVHRFIQTVINDEDIGIIWLPADTEDLLGTHFRTLATELKYDSREDTNRKDLRLIVEHVYRVLHDQKILLVFDNVVLGNRNSSLYFSKYLPKVFRRSNFKIIVTSRNQDWQDFTSNVCRVESLLLSDAIQYIENGLPDLPDVKSRGKCLAEFFDNLPIAIESAVDAISHRQERERILGNHYSLESFLLVLTQLENEDGDRDCNDTAERAYRRLNLLWNQSIHFLVNGSGYGRIAIQVLDYLAFLSPNGIPVKLVMRLCETVDISSENLSDALLLLKSLSLITISDSAKHPPGIKVHRLLQSNRIALLKKDEKLTASYMEFLVMYNRTLPLLQYTDSQYIALSENARTVCENTKRLLLNFSNGAPEKNLGIYYVVNILDALFLFNSVYVSQCVETIEAEASNLNPKTREKLDMIRILGLEEFGKYDDALRAYKEILQVKSHKLGTNHPETLDTKHDIARILDKLGRYKDALIAFQDILRVQSDTLGENHPDTCTTKHNIASVLVNIGKYQEALMIYQEVLKVRLETLGNNHPSNFVTKRNIASIFVTLGKYEDALAAYEELLTVESDTLGTNHPSTLNTKHNMADLLSRMGKYEDALAAFQDVMRLESESLGMKPSKTITTKHNMATVLVNTRKFEDALREYHEILKVQSDTLENNHPSVLATKHSIASVLFQMNNSKDALILYQEVLEGLIDTLGKNHPNTLTAKQNIATVLDSMAKYEEALIIYEEGLKEFSQSLGVDHPSTLATKHNLASVLDHMGKFQDALAAYREVFKVRCQTLGSNHPDTLTTKHNIASVLDSMDKYQDALGTYEEVLKVRSEILGNNHPDTINTKENIASVLDHMGRYEDALLVYNEIQKVRPKPFGNNQPNTTTEKMFIHRVRVGDFCTIGVHQGVKKKQSTTHENNHAETTTEDCSTLPVISLQEYFLRRENRDRRSRCCVV